MGRQLRREVFGRHHPTPHAGSIAEETGSGSGFAWLHFGGTRIFSCYWTPNGSTVAVRLAAFEVFLHGLESAVKLGETLVLAGDFNTKLTSWRSTTTDRKGAALEAFAAILGLWTNNISDRPTFQRGASTSTINVTFSRRGEYEMSGWSVLDDYIANDHNYIEFDITSGQAKNQEDKSNVRWALRKLDHEVLEWKLSEHSLHLSTTSSADALNARLTTLCNTCMHMRNGLFQTQVSSLVEERYCGSKSDSNQGKASLPQGH